MPTQHPAPAGILWPTHAHASDWWIDERAGETRFHLPFEATARRGGAFWQPSTRSRGRPAWVEFDLGRSCAVHSVAFHAGTSPSHTVPPARVTLRGAGTDVEAVSYGSQEPDGSRLHTFPEGALGRFVRVEFDGAERACWCCPQVSGLVVCGAPAINAHALDLEKCAGAVLDGLTLTSSVSGGGSVLLSIAGPTPDDIQVLGPIDLEHVDGATVWHRPLRADVVSVELFEMGDPGKRLPAPALVPLGRVPVAGPVSSRAIAPIQAFASSYDAAPTTSDSGVWFRPTPDAAIEQGPGYWVPDGRAPGSSPVSPSWLLLDLGVARAVTSVGVDFAVVPDRAGVPLDYEIHVLDAIHSDRIELVACNSRNHAARVRHSFPPVSGRYVRVWITGVADGLVPAIAQVRVEGDGSAPVSAPLLAGDDATSSHVVPVHPSQRCVQTFDVLFDGSVCPETYADWLEQQGITSVEFHTYMIGHELVDHSGLGRGWNSYAGNVSDDRMWVDDRVLRTKIACLKERGIAAIAYGASYAATPAFHTRYPEWAARDEEGRPHRFPGPNDCWDGGETTFSEPPYLVLQALHPEVNHPYTIDGTTYVNYREYILDQYVRAVEHYGFRGVRLDFYGGPGVYRAAGLEYASNMSRDIVDLVVELRRRLDAINPEVIVTVIELPNIDRDLIRSGVSRGAVNAHWVEHWPQPHEGGPTYADLAYQTRYTRLLADREGVVVNAYPQPDDPADLGVCLPNGWSASQLHFNFATPFAHGGSWGSGSVDGIGSFTHVLPFDFTYLDASRIALVGAWGRFMREFGTAYAWSNDSVAITPSTTATARVVGGSGAGGLTTVLQQRVDRATGEISALILHCINYSAPADQLRWTGSDITAPTPVRDLVIEIDGVASWKGVDDVIVLTPERANQLNVPLAVDGTTARVSIPDFGHYTMVVIEPTARRARRHDQAPYRIPVPSPKPFDVAADLLWAGGPGRLKLSDKVHLATVDPYSLRPVGAKRYRMEQSWLAEVYDGAGASSLQLRRGDGIERYGEIRIRNFGDPVTPVRFSTERFSRLTFSWSAPGGAIALGFLVVNVEQPKLTRRVMYYAGTLNPDIIEHSAVPTEWVRVSGASPTGLTRVERDLLHDVRELLGWRHSAATSIYWGADRDGARLAGLVVERSPEAAELT